MADFLGQLERNWIVAKAGGAPPTKPLNQIKREYYISVVGATGSGTRMDELEDAWLKQYITDNGGTPTPGAENSTLWKEAVVTIGQTPSKFLNENKKTFYLNAS